MTFGSLAGIELAGRAGAVFPSRLVRVGADNTSRSVTLDGWTTTISDSGKFVAVSTEAMVDIERVESAARRRANEGLDYLCAFEFIDADLTRADDFVLWGTTDKTEATSLRVVAIVSAALELSASVQMVDGNGVTISAPVRAPRAHEALRFIRMSRTSRSRLDAYRNLCLAFESLLHELHPHVRQGQGRQGEGGWFKAALLRADQKVPIAQLAPDGETDVVRWIYEHLYGEFRSGLMHAKDHYLLPTDEYRQVEFEALFVNLWRYVAALMQVVLDTPGRGNSTSPALWAGFGNKYFGEVHAAVTNDLAAADLSESFAHSGKDIYDLPSGDIACPYHGFVVSLTRCPADDVRRLGPLTRIGSVDTNGRLHTATELPMPLTLGDSVDEFQVQLGYRNANEGGIFACFDN